MLWHCDKVQNLLQDIKTTFNQYQINISFTKRSFLLGPYTKNTMAKSVLILGIKFYIYKSKCSETTLSLQSLLNHLRFIYVTYKYIYTQKGKLNLFINDWKIWTPVLGDQNLI